MNNPKILFLDIETSPDLIWAWGVYEQSAIEMKGHWQLLSFSAEWLGGNHITKGLDDYPGYKPGGSDKNLLRDVWKLLDEADIVVGHNAKKFDIKKLNTRFIAQGFNPPSPYKVVDTRNEVKRVAAFSSNKLDWLCQQLDLGKKVRHAGWDMWFGCIGGDPKAWAAMKRYNRHDIVLLKKLYMLLSPWLNQPNTGMWLVGDVCPNPSCGSKRLQSRGMARSNTRVYRRFQCQDCGKWGQSSKAEKGQRANIRNA